MFSSAAPPPLLTVPPLISAKGTWSWSGRPLLVSLFDVIINFIFMVLQNFGVFCVSRVPCGAGEVCITLCVWLASSPHYVPLLSLKCASFVLLMPGARRVLPVSLCARATLRLNASWCVVPAR